MKILGIVGSCRRGNTYSMVEAACGAINDCDVQLLHLKDYKISFCDGCLSCDTKGVCHISDDMTNLIDIVKETDGLIIGSPARWGLISGELKTFFDRLNPLAIPELLHGKKAILFSVGQSKDGEITSIENTIRSLTFFCENSGIMVIDTLSVTECLRYDDLFVNKNHILNECKLSAKKLLNSIKE
jgi:multimeric flavodoxin WrbA